MGTNKHLFYVRSTQLKRVTYFSPQVIKWQLYQNRASGLRLTLWIPEQTPIASIS